MFLDFFYSLRKNGLDVSVGEWMTLMSALDKGLHGQSFTGFYHVARSIVVKSESEFDKFDLTFAEVFKNVPFEGPVPDAAMNPYEITERRYDWRTRSYHQYSGMDWLDRFKSQYRYLIWLNPEPLPAYRNYWTQTHLDLAGKFKMFDLSVDGLDKGIKALMARK